MNWLASGRLVIFCGWMELNMPTIKEMASGYIQQCESKLAELRNQEATVRKQIQALEEHINECLDELNDTSPLDGVESCKISKEDAT